MDFSDIDHSKIFDTFPATYQSIFEIDSKNIDNMAVGVSKGFEKKLQLVGIRYRAMLEAEDLVLNLGFSHPVRMTIPEGLNVKVEENTRIIEGKAGKKK